MRDGFGLSLQKSSTTFRTAALPQFFSQGGTQYGGAVTARFAGTAAPAWPVLTRGDALCLGYPQEAGCAAKGAKHTDFVAVGAADVAAALASLHNYRETQLKSPVVASLVAPLTPSLARTDRRATPRGGGRWTGALNRGPLRSRGVGLGTVFRG